MLPSKPILTVPLLYGGWPVRRGCVNSKQSSVELCWHKQQIVSHNVVVVCCHTPALELEGRGLAQWDNAGVHLYSYMHFHFYFWSHQFRIFSSIFWKFKIIAPILKTLVFIAFFGFHWIFSNFGLYLIPPIPHSPPKKVWIFKEKKLPKLETPLFSEIFRP